jgi:glutamate formiminotransferase
MANALTRREDAWLLDTHEDPSHHRSVITAAIAPEALVDASCALAAEAVRLIDLKHHEGVHPRTGSLDVLPFVPLRDVTRDELIALARDVAAAIARRFDLPVFLAGDAAADPRRSLAELRRGGVAMLRARLDEGELVPDFGPHRLHGTAGATVVAVRDFLIAYNVALASTDVYAARAIARAIRASGGGLPSLQALGMALPHRDLVQVSMNLTNFRRTSLMDAFDAVRAEAGSRRIRIDHSELVGLIPADAAFEGMVERLRLETEPGIIEERLRAAGVG